MSLLNELNERLKTAIKAKDGRTASVIRMIKARVTDKTKAKGFSGEVDDALVQGVIGAYVKQMSKALDEYNKAGESAREHIDELEFEIAYLKPLLPSKLDRAATRELVAAKLDELGISDPRQVGRVMGAVMKTHRDQVDGKLVRAVAEELLSG